MIRGGEWSIDILDSTYGSWRSKIISSRFQLKFENDNIEEIFEDIHEKFD